MVTTKIYDGKSLARAVTGALSNVPQKELLVCTEILFLKAQLGNRLPLTDRVTLQRKLIRHAHTNWWYSTAFAIPWSIVSDPACDTFWDIKWLLTNNDSEEVTVKVSDFVIHLSSDVRQCLLMSFSFTQGVKGDDSNKSNGMSGQCKRCPVVKENISQTPSSCSPQSKSDF